MENSLNRDEITEKVIQLFVDTIGFIERDQVTEQTDFIHDFKIIDDDLACFVMQVEWQFKLHSSQKDWNSITTIKQIVDLITHRSD
ncbi:acyl carrier protein [Pseudomonas sp. MWU13-2100]|uniref:acyl carrier protein n=1 Tax=Pseudomonas sp. MWU13-2100 TaxID=2935075 RepID=UPI00200F06B2|nr:acyl carrier protein [Pseudomonas sp. MWU13-2100]